MKDISKFVSEESRRSVLKKGALATAGAGIVGSGVGSVAAQEGDDDDVGEDETDVGTDDWQKALLNVGHARPGRNFIITAPVLDWSPDVEDIEDSVWGDYNTRVIRYLNSDEQLLFWVAREAELPEYSEEHGYVVDAEGDTADDGTPQPEIYQLRREFSPFGDAAYVTVNFAPVGEDEEDTLLDLEDWWFGNGETDGTATTTPTGNDGNQTS